MWTILCYENKLISLLKNITFTEKFKQDELKKLQKNNLLWQKHVEVQILTNVTLFEKI